MATIKADGVYRDADGNQFRFLKGHVVPDEAEYERVGDFPEPGQAAKAAPAPENKKQPEPSNKSDKG